MTSSSSTASGCAGRPSCSSRWRAATAWLPEYSAWCARWEELLKKRTVKDDKRVYTHERLRKARRRLNEFVKSGTLFAFVEMQQEHGGKRRSTNNA